MEAVQRVRETVEVGRGQMYEKARDLVFFSRVSRRWSALWSTRRSMRLRAGKKRGKPFSPPLRRSDRAGGESTSGCPNLPRVGPRGLAQLTIG